MDLAALKDRIANLNRRNTGPTLWKPKDEHQVRLLPSPAGSEPFQDLFFHNEIGDAPAFLCPKMNFDEDCEVCDFAETLKNWNLPDGKEKPEAERKADWEVFKKIQAKARCHQPMVERSKDGTVQGDAQWWSMTPDQAKQCLEVCADGDRLQEVGAASDDAEAALRILFDVKKGYDLAVSYAKPGQKGNTKGFTTITIKGRIKSSELSKNEAEVTRILSSIKPLKDLYSRMTSAEVSKILKKFIGDAAPVAKSDVKDDEAKYKQDEKKPSNTKENAALSGTRSLDDAFGDMMSKDEVKK